MEFPSDSNLIVGMDRLDDAGVYKLTDNIAIIQTVDFFTPIVDDPYSFGQIAAANALSDVYAMGGEPKTAMNLVTFPSKKMDISILRKIIQGGLDKIKEAGVVLVGGHSVEDLELKYGLSVTGIVHPDMILKKSGFKAGVRLILTKPLGTGIINTAIKAGLASLEAIQEVTLLMSTLNRIPAEVMKDFPVHACTDITGFGLLGHLAQMVENSGLGITVYCQSVPLIFQAIEYASTGLVPAGTYNNRKFRESIIDFGPSVERVFQDILFDPQTSGGLLIAVEKKSADDLLTRLKKNGIKDAAVIGEVVEKPEIRIIVT